MTAMIKKAWKWIVGSSLLFFFLMMWYLSGRRSGYAARQILKHQERTEEKIEKIKTKTNKELEELDKIYEAEYQSIRDDGNKKIEKIEKQVKELSAKALREEVLKDL